MAQELWAYLQSQGKKLHGSAAKMASEVKRATRFFSGSPCGVLFHDNPAVVDELKNYGLEKIYFFHLQEELTPEEMAGQIFSLAEINDPEAIFFAANAKGSEVGARLAAKMRKKLYANVIDYEEKGKELIARKPLFGRKGCGYYPITAERPHIATIYEDALDAIATRESKKVELVYPGCSQMRPGARRLKRWKLPLHDISLQEAAIVIGIGGGVKDKSFISEIQELAQLLEASIGGSRVAVSKELISPGEQIGATGEFLSAEIYIPLGISGSNRHTVGLRDVKRIFPINKDKNAPIFKFSEKGAVTDIHQVVPLVKKHLQEKMAKKGDDNENSSMC